MTSLLFCRTTLLGSALIAFVPSVFGCSCSFPDVRGAVRKADLVFRGKLIKVEYIDEIQNTSSPLFKDRKIALPRRFLATLEVNAVWKGHVGPVIVFHTREGSSDCVGFWTDVGKEYLVFANEGKVTPKEPGVFRIPEWTDRVSVGEKIISPGVCTLSEEIESSTSKTLRELGSSKRPAPR